MNYNTPKDLLNESDYEVYSKLKWPNTTLFIYPHLKTLVEANPDYELWVPLNYVSTEKSRNEGVGILRYNDNSILVSSKGRIKRGEEEPFLPNYVKATKRRRIQLTNLEHDVRNNVRNARVVACCFIPLLGKYLEKGYENLVVNHMDLDTTNDDFTNLEWITQSENVLHANAAGARDYVTGLDNHLATNYLGEVVGIPEYNGTKFILSGLDDAKRYSLTGANKVVLDRERVAAGLPTNGGSVTQAKGCTFYRATEENLKTYPLISKLPKALLDAIANHNSNYGDPIYGINPTDLTIHKFNGAEELRKAGFNLANVYTSCVDQITTSKGWMFIKGSVDMTDESITQQLRDKLHHYHSATHYRTRVVEATDKKTGVKTIIVGKPGMIALGFNPKTAFKQAQESKDYKGYSLKEIQFELEHLLLNA